MCLRFSICYLHVNASFHGASTLKVQLQCKTGEISPITSALAHTNKHALSLSLQNGHRCFSESVVRLGPMMKVTSEREEKKNEQTNKNSRMKNWANKRQCFLHASRGQCSDSLPSASSMSA